MDRSTLLIVEDHWAQATRLRQLATEAGFEQTALATSHDEAIRLSMILAPAATLISLSGGGSREAAFRLGRILQSLNGTPVVFADSAESSTLRDALASARKGLDDSDRIAPWPANRNWDEDMNQAVA